MRILIVKTSAFGDIIQTFPVVEFLKKQFPKSQVHFAVLEENQELPLAHPLIDKVVSFSRKSLLISFFKALFFGRRFSLLKKESYDLVFDLQGNLRSGLVTFLASSPKKIGFGRNSISEWPNLLFSNIRYEVDLKTNIRFQYLSVVQEFFKEHFNLAIDQFDLFAKRLLRLNQQEEALKKAYFPKLFQSSFRKKAEVVQKEEKENNTPEKRILIAPFSKWPSKALDFKLLVNFLKQIEAKYQPLFLFLQGSDEEGQKSAQIASHFGSRAIVLDKLSLPLLQHVMEEVDLVIGMDSCPLHLAILAKRPTVSFFGPTAASVYGALGEAHLIFKGKCLLKLSFDKRCSSLRSCTERCIDQSSQEELFERFSGFWQNIGEMGSLAGSGRSSL